MPTPVAALAGSPADRLPGFVSLGEEITSVIEISPGIWLKLDFELPTGSFKARGAAVMMGMARDLGVGRVVTDSSGNAGKAVAAYAQAAGLEAEVHVPAETDPGKVTAMRGYGANVVVDAGDRQAATEAALVRVSEGAGWYAHHAYQPAFHHGVKTLAFELFDQIPGIESGTVIVPAGNGTLVLGLWIGFRDLISSGRADRSPAIVAVQSERCGPLAGLAPAGLSLAAGIAIPRPPRGGQVRAAVLASGGVITTVSEDAIEAGRADLRQRGIDVEPTGAVSWSVPSRDRYDHPLVVVLTGR